MGSRFMHLIVSEFFYSCHTDKDTYYYSRA